MTDSNNPHNLKRFVKAQKGEIDQVKQELQVGNKQTHWMWYVFPQIIGLGNSSKSERYAIKSREEAEAYLAHDILGPRLQECTTIVNEIEGKSAYEIFGSPDHKKFCSSMTLFDAVTEPPSPFNTALEKYYDTSDEYTLQFLSE